MPQLTQEIDFKQFVNYMWKRQAILSKDALKLPVIGTFTLVKV